MSFLYNLPIFNIIRRRLIEFKRFHYLMSSFRELLTLRIVSNLVKAKIWVNMFLPTALTRSRRLKFANRVHRAAIFQSNSPIERLTLTVASRLWIHSFKHTPRMPTNWNYCLFMAAKSADYVIAKNNRFRITRYILLTVR